VTFRLVLLLGAGALLGPSVLDLVDVPYDALGAQLVFVLGVAAILFYGGLHLSPAVLSRARLSLGLLATVGVLITALVVGTAGALAFDLPFSQGLLMGAVLAPTDPAILIPLFVGSRLRARLAQTIVAESALNDTTGAILTLALAGAVDQLAIGFGYLAAFAAGVILRRLDTPDFERGARIVTELVTVAIFLLVGANLPFSTLGHHLLPAGGVIAALLLLARPLAVAACLLPDGRSGWTRAELTFMVWTRETGAVPAALVGVLAAHGQDHADLLAGVVALAILVTLLVQALPAPWLARRLGLVDMG
jgi:cell volume regulation protein A